MQDEDFNLYKNDGSVFLPFRKDSKTAVEKNFNNIQHIGFYNGKGGFTPFIAIKV